MTQPHDDEYGELLRRVLRAEAESLTPSPDGLERIRARTANRGIHRWFASPWFRPAVALGGTLLVVAVAMLASGPILHLHGNDVGQDSRSQSQHSQPNWGDGSHHPGAKHKASPTDLSPTPSGSPTQTCGASKSRASGRAMRSTKTAASPCPSTPPPHTSSPPSSPTPPRTTPPTSPSGKPTVSPSNSKTGQPQDSPR